MHVLAAEVYQNPVAVLFGLVYLVLIIYCAYRTARNGHWLLFVLGLFCGGLFWIIGALIGPKNRY